MSRILTSSHAEDVGSAVVEPGEPIPDDADEGVVERLEREGKIRSVEDAPPPRARRQQQQQEG